jgi:hypothetical protein
VQELLHDFVEQPDIRENRQENGPPEVIAIGIGFEEDGAGGNHQEIQGIPENEAVNEAENINQEEAPAEQEQNQMVNYS